MPFYTGGVRLDDSFFSNEDLVNQYVTFSGPLWSWGGNSNGSLQAASIGNGGYGNYSSPIQNYLGNTNWQQVSSNFFCVAEIRYDGTLWLCGKSFHGQLGNDKQYAPDYASEFRFPVETISGGTDWKQVSVGGYTTGAIKTDGTLWLWGEGAGGQLGDNTVLKKSSPVQTITGGNNWKYVSIAGYNGTAIKTDGTLWLWGSNHIGQLGDNTTVNKSSPIQVMTGGNWSIISNSSYNNAVAGIKTDGTLWVWGYNASGQLGDNTTIDKSSPVQIITGGTWRSVDSMASNMAGIKSDGTLWTWGFNDSGQLGDNTTITRSSPVQTVAGGNNWRRVACGQNHMSAVKTDGTLWTWGSNSFGQLGDNTTVNKSSPIQTLKNVNTWRQLSCGYNNTSAIQDLG